MTAVDERPARVRGVLGICAGPCGRVIVAESMPRELRPEGCVERRGRGLCGTCYAGVAGTEDLADYPRVNRSADELLDDWTVLRLRNVSREAAAPLLGYSSLESFERVLTRLRAARPDDPRTALGRKRDVLPRMHADSPDKPRDPATGRFLAVPGE